jgi:hypothetical protein
MGIRYALPLRMTLISRLQMRVRTVQTGEEMYAAACFTVSRRGTIDCPTPLATLVLVGCAFEEPTTILLEETFNASGNGRRMDALSAPESDDESLIGIPSPYRHSESRTETEHRRQMQTSLG